MTSARQRRLDFDPTVTNASVTLDTSGDLDFLRRRVRPDYESGGQAISIVDLFSGCGGMTLGLAHAAHRLGRAVRVPLAMDLDANAIAVFKENFPWATCETDDVCKRFGGDLKAKRRTNAERATREAVGPDLDVLVGGPPCQGHSDLNNHTRRTDRRNALYARMARAAFVLSPWFVIIENVPAVEHDAGAVVNTTVRELRRLKYDVDHRVIDLSLIGVPQHRRRHIVLASRSPNVSASKILELLDEGLVDGPRDVRWAIDDLKDVDPQRAFDRPAPRSEENAARIDWLFDNRRFELPNEHRPKCHRNNGHTYKSVYGRLRWDLPAQTITTGFSSMGQGRYVHPSRRRTLTPHEAARLQCFPDFFSFDIVMKRSALSTLIGNAVPPLLTLRLGELLFAPARGSDPAQPTIRS